MTVLGGYRIHIPDMRSLLPTAGLQTLWGKLISEYCDFKIPLGLSSFWSEKEKILAAFAGGVSSQNKVF